MKQLEIDGKKLWIVTTDKGVKRCWSESRKGVLDIAKKCKIQIISLRVGTDNDSILDLCK